MTSIIGPSGRSVLNISFNINTAPSVKNMLEAELKHYEFFGIKSGDVDKDGRIDTMLNPQGILLPLIWLLIKLKLY